MVQWELFSALASLIVYCFVNLSPFTFNRTWHNLSYLCPLQVDQEKIVDSHFMENIVVWRGKFFLGTKIDHCFCAIWLMKLAANIMNFYSYDASAYLYIFNARKDVAIFNLKVCWIRTKEK